jgi:hypothetical protein
VTENAQAPRERNGRWRCGASGNPKGRPRGAKDNGPRRRVGQRENAAEWTQRDWQTFFRQIVQRTDGRPDARHGAAYSECVALWLLLNPPVQRAGLCVQCGKPLNPPVSTVNGAPVRVDGAWLHWACLPWFLRARWDTAKAGLERLGIWVGV